VTKFDEVFSGYWLYQVSLWNPCFKDHFGHHHQGSDMSLEPPVSQIYTSLVLAVVSLLNKIFHCSTYKSQSQEKK